MIKYLNCLVIAFLLTSCTGDQCIDADDFGFDKVTISSRYSPNQLTVQEGINQVAPWIDSGLAVNGRPLAIQVRTWRYSEDGNKASKVSAWCPWFGLAGNEHVLSRFCERLQDCIFPNGMCPDGTCSGDTCALSIADEEYISNAPCLMRNGIGSYALVSRPENDPNVSMVSQRNPTGLTFHLGEPQQGYQLYEYSTNGNLRNAGGVIYKYNDSDALKQQYANSKLYFKILDKYYDDNNGQYRIVIKSGVNPSRPDPLQFLTDLVINNLFGTDNDYGLIRNIYTGITQNTAYRSVVSALLSLYIMFTAFSFLTGNLNITHTELIIRVIKVSIVSALISSEYSWSFFNDYLFSYFVGGVQQMVNIIQEAGATGPGASSSIISLMIAPQTMAKLWALLFVDWRGFIYIILFLIALAFLFALTLEATIIYLTALVAIGMIIVMAPIFICCMLFEITRSLFDNWLKQLIGYALQPIILFTGLAFMGILISHEIYTSLGFRVCKHDFLNLEGISEVIADDDTGADPSMVNSFFYWWFPSPMKGENFTRVQRVIPIPEGFVQEDNSYCSPYECLGNRYLELPFLDPATEMQRINNFFQGNFVQLDGLLLIFVALYLLSKFNEFSISAARFIGNISGNSTDIRGIGLAASAPILNAMSSPARKLGEQFRQRVTSKISAKISGTVGGLYESVMMNSLRKDAIGSGANQSVIDEVKRKYGMDRKDLNKGAEKQYLEALRAKVSKDNPSLKGMALEKKVMELAQKDYKNLPAQYKDPKLQKLASEMQFVREYQNAYVETHQAMSAKGVGFFGKRISALRGYQELQNKVQENKARDEEKKLNRGRAIYAGYEGVKRGIITKLVGKELSDALEGSATGAAWHDFNYNDPRLRTQNEVLQDDKKREQRDELMRQIDAETVAAKNDVLQPEYLANLQQRGNLANLEYYRELARAKVAYEAKDALSSGEDPVLMGDRFMREKATDSQSRAMIDKAYDMQKRLIEEDRYIRRGEYYEASRDIAAQEIMETRKLLAEHFKRDNVTLEEMPKLITEYYKDRPEDMRKELAAFEGARQEFSYNQMILDKIDERKAWIKEEVDANIESINSYRKAAGMSHYAKPVEIEKRRLHTIEEHIRSYDKPEVNAGQGKAAEQPERAEGQGRGEKGEPKARKEGEREQREPEVRKEGQGEQREPEARKEGEREQREPEARKEGEREQREPEVRKEGEREQREPEVRKEEERVEGHPEVKQDRIAEQPERAEGEPAKQDRVEDEPVKQEVEEKPNQALQPQPFEQDEEDKAELKPENKEKGQYEQGLERAKEAEDFQHKQEELARNLKVGDKPKDITEGVEVESKRKGSAVEKRAKGLGSKPKGGNGE